MGEQKGTNQTGQSLRFVFAWCYRPDSNLVFSLFSNQAALAFVATRAEGATLENVRLVLETFLGGSLDMFFAGAAMDIVTNGQAEGGPSIGFSNGVWVDESLSLNAAFIMRAMIGFNAEDKTCSFQSKADDVRCKVNSRVRNATTDIIPELLPTGSVNHKARLILENSLYFMGVWEDKVDASQTEESEFWISDRSSVRVPFFTRRRHIFFRNYDGFKVLKLLYKKGEGQRQFTMSIILPDDPDRLREIESRFGSYFPDCSYENVMVGEFKLPKFKISFGFEPSQVFKRLATGRGDLKGMVDSSDSDGGRLYMSSIYHRSVVEVSEEGTEAAAATAAVVEVEEGTEAATVEVVEGTKVANATAAVAVEEAEEGTEAAALNSAVSVEGEVGTESATVTSADSLKDDKEGTEAADSNSDVSVEDDEKGTESVTVTSFDWMEEDEEGIIDPVILKVDRPFAFVIREEGTGSVLFAGYLLNPLTPAVRII